MVTLPKRRGLGHNKAVARADGYYMRGDVKFKLRKGSNIPRHVDEVFYYGDAGIEKGERVTATDAIADRLAEDAAIEAEENAAEDVEETPEKPRRGRKASTT